MRYSRVALFLALAPGLGLAACAEQADEGAPAMEMAAMDMAALAAEMDQLQSAWKQAYEAGNAAGVAALYTDDAVYLAPYNDAIHGRAAIEARFAEQMGMMSGRITIERTDYGGSGDLSYGIGTYAVEMQMEGAEAPMTENGKYITLAKRGADGSWKIYAHIWNTSLPEAEVARMLSEMAGMSEMSEMSEM